MYQGQIINYLGSRWGVRSVWRSQVDDVTGDGSRNSQPQRHPGASLVVVVVVEWGCQFHLPGESL